MKPQNHMIMEHRAPGNLVIADTASQRVRELTGAATPGRPARG
jgi:hypothetical protein